MKIAPIIIFACLPALAACHHDTRPAWQRAEAVPHLDIPADVDAPGRSAEMLVPGAEDSKTVTVADSLRPPVGITLYSDSDVAATWVLVTSKVDALGEHTILDRDDAARSLDLTIKGSSLPGANAGFWHGLFHNTPDPEQDYFASVDVKSVNGETLIALDGDGRAVLYLKSLIKGTSHVQTGS